ncbi:hypothetical protein TeGR_g5020 [Tetraparma gracilis]|uniref:non-specific serine/threonine protein kinase n=1 Tax=Tetraparma gracilis TaxID=2962635 RepID=A0ABQ6MFY3_9STRA|nr:hypothetical protein TeGR_g5020 [Tetraparma gracilis]
MPPKRKVGRYEIGQTLGEGTFGKVKYAINTETQEAVAIKVLDKDKIQQQNMGQQIKKEISIMKVVRHPNIVKLKEVLASRTKIFIVLELVVGGELFDQIVKEGRFNDEKARKYFRQLVTGLSYCNSKGVCHRDLKPENLLLDGQANLKISDFGLSALYTGGDGDGEAINRTTMLHTTCGTPNYVAPEVLEDKGYDGRKADIWSCGVILYVLLAGFLPFDERTMPELFAKIQNADVKYPTFFSAGAKDLLSKILTNDPAARITLDQIKEHEWFTDGGKLTTEDVFEPTEGDEVADGEDAGNASLDETAEEAGPAVPMTPRTAEAARIRDMEAQNTMTRTQSEAQVKRIFQFKTRGNGPGIVQKLSESLGEMECELKVFEEQLRIKACKMTSKGMIGVVLQVFLLEEDLYVVEVRRGKGDIMEYAKFWNELTKEKIADMIQEIVTEIVQGPGEDD